ncbi:glutathione peroxidase [Rhizobiales bacterium]|uniref:glutathione peroxidase n=1 Tax=Hongsoonwoonella zoysiae TaxID=2821844 RepID=UPI0015603AE3|nr:glutathione peroxidase [Hongsoonwoonella zoysiae]NRG17777.1 glutathione peroxidase [Hongsoonwoonella zoysiae]
MLIRVLMVFSLFFGASAVNAAETGQSAHDFTFTAIEGHELPMSDYAGKAVLVVNTASFCGFTHQYSDLQAVWEKYRDRGLVVLGVPSNDFGSQEPGSEAEIKQFCEVNFSIDFPLTEKEVVKGDGAHPFYVWARAALGAKAAPRWNFHKYLVGPDGHLVAWFPTAVSPSSKRVTQAIEAQLSKVGAGKSGS